MDCGPKSPIVPEELRWRSLISRKLIMGESCIVALAWSAELRLSEVALYGLILIALVAVGFQGWADVAKVWGSLKPSSIVGEVVKACDPKPVVRTRP